ncbi:hypothetical protein Tco_1061960 [Tanacetum coccineum]
MDSSQIFSTSSSLSLSKAANGIGIVILDIFIIPVSTTSFSSYLSFGLPIVATEAPTLVSLDGSALELASPRLPPPLEPALGALGISKLYFAMYTCSSHVIEMAHRSFDAALHFALERIVTASGPDYSLLADRLSCFYILIAFWQSQMEDHTSDWLRVVPISGMGQTMNGDIYRDHVVSCAGIIVIKHRHNLVRDTLVDICFRLGILAGKEVDIGLGSSPLTHTGMVHFVPGRVVIDVAHHKRVKYEAKCVNIGYGFLPFSFSSLGELDKDAVTLLKQI